ncbi:MAG: hypothetical protein ACKPHU_36685, partial [Planctomycetaceae bacterium]
LTLDGSTVHIRWNQSDITNNAEKLRQALVNLTGDSGVYVRFDQKSLILNQRYFVRFTGAPGVITGSEGTMSGTVTIETENPGSGSINEVQALAVDAGTATGTFRISIPVNGRT